MEKNDYVELVSHVTDTVPRHPWDRGRRGTGRQLQLCSAYVETLSQRRVISIRTFRVLGAEVRTMPKTLDYSLPRLLEIHAISYL
jgi:hypothetical protein